MPTTEARVHMNGKVDSAPEWIRGILEARITTRHLEPGARIGLKAELQEEFDVSGPTLDQALALLENDGLIHLRRGPKGGVFVSRSEPVLRLGSKKLWARDALSLGENIELREALTSLLGVSAARCAHHAQDKLEELAAVADELENAEISFETQLLIWRGHRILLELSDNTALRVVYVNLLDAAESLIIRVDFPTVGPEASRERRRIEAHANLFRAVVDGDVELAHEYGEVVRLVSPLGRDGHEVTVGSSDAQRVRAPDGRSEDRS